MANTPLRDILISARQESFRMRHYFLGVEHLFIALLNIQGGLTASILEECGYTPEYVIDAIRRRTGKGGRNRLWAGLPNTPRTEIILSIASDLALEAGREEVTERDLLCAILDENDSIPVRVLRRMGLDLTYVMDQALTRDANAAPTRPYVSIAFGPDFDPGEMLTEEQLFLLRRMFAHYAQVRVERKLTGGYTRALLVVVTPIHPDKREDAPVVVKIDYADEILDEAQRYETHVKASLPALTARLEDKPTAPDTSDLAGLKYTFVGKAGSAPRDLRALAAQWTPVELGRWLREQLLPTFGRTWWLQHRPFRFQVWAEYDWMLPPMLTLELDLGEEPPAQTPVIREPIKPARLRDLEYGELVIIENFTVQRIYPDRDAIRIAVGRGTEAARRAYKIEVRNVDLARNTYYRGEIIERIVGRVYKTRAEALMLAARALEPDFDLRSDLIPGIDPDIRLPNPLVIYQDLLDFTVNGSLSRIHGDLHPGNIMVGPNDSPFLIDFAQTREGHTLADWANLEVSLLTELVMPSNDQEWDTVRQVARCWAYYNARGELPTDLDIRLAEAFEAIIAVRVIASRCLAQPDVWSEYFVSLAMSALRAMTWDTVRLGGRRLMFLLVALSILELRQRTRRTGMETSPDETDYTNFTNTNL